MGTDVDERLLRAANDLVRGKGLGNVEVVRDDLFDSRLPAHSFDLVHARFQLAPLGRFDEQLASFRRLLRPGGVLVLEDPDTSSWRYQPEAAAADRLIQLILQAFRAGGGDFDAGRREYGLLVDAGYEPLVRADIVALPPGHPYLRLPLQFAASLRPRLLQVVGEAELTEPGRWGLTFTLVQTWCTAP